MSRGQGWDCRGVGPGGVPRVFEVCALQFRVIVFGPAGLSGACVRRGGDGWQQNCPVE